MGHSKWIYENNSVQWKPCQILGFDKNTHLYKIQWSNDKDKTKEVTRLNLIVENENFEGF